MYVISIFIRNVKHKMNRKQNRIKKRKKVNIIILPLTEKRIRSRGKGSGFGHVETVTCLCVEEMTSDPLSLQIRSSEDLDSIRYLSLNRVLPSIFPNPPYLYDLTGYAIP